MRTKPKDKPLNPYAVTLMFRPEEKVYFLHGGAAVCGIVNAVLLRVSEDRERHELELRNALGPHDGGWRTGEHYLTVPAERCFGNPAELAENVLEKFSEPGASL